MDKPTKHTFVVLHDWMTDELGLKGNERTVYAIIYGFCQDGKSHFVGGRSYLAKWTNSTVRGVQNNLNSLLEKGLIAKEEKIVNGVKVCEYYPINLPWDNEEDGEQNQTEEGRENISPPGKKVPQGGEKSSLGVGKKVPQGGEKSSPNNIKSNIKGNIETASSSDGMVEAAAPAGQRTSEMVARVIEEWNRLQDVGIKPVSKVIPGSTRHDRLVARLREYGLENVLRAVRSIAQSKYLQGHGRNGWSIKFDWFIRPSNFPKVLEGNYIDDDKNTANYTGRGGNNYANSGQESGEYSGGRGGRPGQDNSTKKYDPRDYFGSLVDA